MRPPIDPRRWDELQATFDALVNLDPGERATRLAALGVTDPALRTALEPLLAADAAGLPRLAPLDAAFFSVATPARDPLNLVGRAVSHFHVLEPLGAGGMGVVYRAEDTRLGRAVALKFLLPHSLDDSAKARFLREARAAAALDHPTLCTLYEVGESEDGRLFLAMALYSGETLAARLARDGPLPVSNALEIARQIARGLGCAHAAGIVHRDLKPGNVMLLPDGTVKILDFGLAKTRDANLSDTGARLGTVAYMAPEQIRGRTVDARADLWAFGVVLYEMLTGRKPFAGEDAIAIAHAIAHDEPVSPSTLRERLPAWVDRVVLALLQKDPGRRYATVDELIAHLANVGIVGATDRAPRRPSVRRVAGILGVAVMLAGAIMAVRRVGNYAPLDPNLVAVAPFDVLDRRLEEYREGLVDLVSASLDGAGPLRAVPVSRVLKAWSGPGDSVAATTLGRSTGAALSVYGRVVGSGPDSVRVAITLLDVVSGTTREIEVRDLATRLDRVADSTVIRVLRELSRTRPIAAVRSASLGSTSGLALKAFLRGEQFYRKKAADSAMAYYRRAVELDSTFALAWMRMGSVRDWQSSVWVGGDSLVRLYWLRAAAFNQRLPARDSLMIVGESLYLALNSQMENYDTAWHEHRARLFATLDELTRRWPEDAEGFFHLGQAHAALPLLGRTSLRRALEAYDRVFALDSAFLPAYPEAIGIALQLDGPASARRYLSAYLARAPTAPDAETYQLIDRILAHPLAQARGLQRLIGTTTTKALQGAMVTLWGWPDSAENDLQVARALGDSDVFGLVFTLAYHGRLQEASNTAARAAVDTARDPGERAYYANLPVLFIDHLSSLEDMPPESITTQFGGWLARGHAGGLRWSAARGDTSSIWRKITVSDSVARSALQPGQRRLAFYDATRGRAYLALARHDTSDALRRFLPLADSLCYGCGYGRLRLDQLTTAQLLVAQGRDGEAARLLDLNSGTPPLPLDVVRALEGGRAAERLGDHDNAVAAYRFVVNAWAHADPVLQPYVSEAHAALRRLRAEVRS